MSDNLTNTLVTILAPSPTTTDAPVPLIVKSVPYASVDQALPYLIRRSVLSSPTLFAATDRSDAGRTRTSRSSSRILLRDEGGQRESARPLEGRFAVGLGSLGSFVLLCWSFRTGVTWAVRAVGAFTAKLDLYSPNLRAATPRATTDLSDECFSLGTDVLTPTAR